MMFGYCKVSGPSYPTLYAKILPKLASRSTLSHCMGMFSQFYIHVYVKGLDLFQGPSLRKNVIICIKFTLPFVIKGACFHKISCIRPTT